MALIFFGPRKMVRGRSYDAFNFPLDSKSSIYTIFRSLWATFWRYWGAARGRFFWSPSFPVCRFGAQLDLTLFLNLNLVTLSLFNSTSHPNLIPVGGGATALARNGSFVFYARNTSDLVWQYKVCAAFYCNASCAIAGSQGPVCFGDVLASVATGNDHRDLLWRNETVRP